MFNSYSKSYIFTQFEKSFLIFRISSQRNASKHTLWTPTNYPSELGKWRITGLKINGLSVIHHLFSLHLFKKFFLETSI